MNDVTASLPLIGRPEDWAERQPDKIAFFDNQGSITWRELNQRADNLAAAIQAKGIGENDVVVARMHNRIEWTILHCALSKLSCTMLGLNWRLTPAEVRYILDNSQARAFFCDDEDPQPLLEVLDECDIQLKVSVQPSKGFNVFDDLLATAGMPLRSVRDPQLIIYTSGTTGFPKGVLVNRHNSQGGDTKLREYQASVRGAPPQTPDTVLITMPMHHAAGPAIVRTGLAYGSTMILMARFDAERALQLIHQHKVTVWNGVPTMFKRMAELPQSTIDKYDLSSIRSLSVGAAPVSHELKLWIMETFGDCLRENYGSTEAGMVAGLTPEMQKLKPGSSGKPFAHVEVSIRDENGEEVPLGQVGDIWVRTPALVQSYIGSGRMDRTTLDENGFFNMGDVGRLDQEGYLYITDRSKDMIISGGVNIYPAEIEAVIQRHPAIHDVAVIGIPHDEFGEEVKAFCELKPHAAVSADELQTFVEPLLASYKRPRSYEFVTELPRNTMGKVLKRELREPYWRERTRRV